MANISTAELFGKDTYTDVTLSYGRATFKAHKIILSQKSNYFKNRLENDLDEGGVLYIDDGGDSFAIGAMLRWIYTFEYPAMGDEQKNWRLHLRMAEMGERFGLAELTSAAISKILAAPVRGEQMFKETLAALPQYRHISADVEQHERTVRKEHLVAMLRTPEYRQSIGEQDGLLSEYLGQSAEALCKIKAHVVDKNNEAVTPAIFDTIVQEAFNGFPLAQ
ncbi:cytochrome c oxidase subunit 1 [Elasticomyces elasticus]|nr:cytochrome c oxidase subunit 1 [Elasticomyces elasticus]KAK3647697.1 cytochrome c oxidase subunit 1 [Elasticomyces elasticus]KAK4908114.1 cytochrome c oxidase subunit 1 [Elasticomyces elasticus]KAK5748087.1 cytochrome c oxidase subunit 1 [Elasticomyces elasticus]